MSLFITTIIDDFGDISSFLFLPVIITYGCNWNGISSSCNGATDLRLASSVLLSLMPPFFLFFLGLFLDFPGLSLLFSLVELILDLQGLLVSLIIPKIETDFQKLFSLRARLILMSTFWNLGPGLSIVGCSD